MFNIATNEKPNLFLNFVWIKVITTCDKDKIDCYDY